MAFNSYSYHANRTAREAWDYLAQARDVRDRQRRGDAYSWERPVDCSIKLARLSMHQSLTYRRLRQLQRERTAR
jgi:hypothetical protein